jgi:hypothetical protein
VTYKDLAALLDEIMASSIIVNANNTLKQEMDNNGDALSVSMDIQVLWCRIIFKAVSHRVRYIVLNAKFSTTIQCEVILWCSCVVIKKYFIGR